MSVERERALIAGITSQDGTPLALAERDACMQERGCRAAQVYE